MRAAITEENSPAWNPGLRIVQLDLARKMETPEFVKGYIDRVASVGYDTLCWFQRGFPCFPVKNVVLLLHSFGTSPKDGKAEKDSNT